MKSKRAKRTESERFWRSRERSSRALAKSKRKLLLCIILLLAIAAIIATLLLFRSKSGEPSEEEIIQRISKFDLPQQRPWITKIENAEQQARLYPALFNGTKDGQYALRYETLFAVYDYREDKIIRQIPIMRIRIEE